MTMRSFVDAFGTAWEVFEVLPSTGGRTVSRVPEDFRAGWLCFQSNSTRHRYAPIPDDWETWDIEQLTLALSATHGFPRRTPHEVGVEGRPHTSRDEVH